MNSKAVVTFNPATNEQLASYQSLDEAGIDAALELAVAVQRDWQKTELDVRSQALRNLANILRAEVEEHASLISNEMGKPISEARGEVLKCATTCDYYAEHLVEYLSPKTVKTEAVRSFVRYEPLGVIFAVMPWNFPYWQVIRFAAPTLAAGNAGLLKHASNVTGAAVAIESAIERAGFPKGLFTSLVVADHSAVNRIVEDPRVAAVTLTGSEKAGSMVAEAAGRALKKTVLELGGSDPFVVLNDANIEAIAPYAVKARFINTGQSCLCAKRFIVQEGVVADFELRIKEIVEKLVIGDPLDSTTQIGPLAKASFVDEIDAQVQESIALGARLVTGGHRIDGPGNYYAPTILADVTQDMPVFNQETFGPVLALVSADTPANAISLANNSQYGLAASIWTANPDVGLELGSGINSGALFINGVVASDPRLPFGGVKLSGYGRELSIEGMHEFLNVRAVWIGDMPSVA